MTVDVATQSSGPASTWGMIGHGRALAALARAIERDTISHAYLISGPAGVGKSTLTRRLAQALLCERSLSERPCGTCSTCRRVDEGKYPDVDIWSLARQIAEGGKEARLTGLSIETARLISASVSLRPFEGRWRVVVVEDAETLTIPAQQAMLKTLEEPTGFTVFVVLAAEPDAMLDTIRSRCQEIALQLVATPVIAAALIERGMDPSIAIGLAALSRGRPGWVVAAAADPQVAADERERMQEAERWVRATLLDRQIRAYKTGDRFTKSRQAVIAEVQAAEVVWRDLLLATAGSPEVAADPGRGDRLSAVLTLSQAHAALAATRLGISDLRANVRPRLALQAMVSSWPTLSS